MDHRTNKEAYINNGRTRSNLRGRLLGLLLGVLVAVAACACACAPSAPVEPTSTGTQGSGQTAGTEQTPAGGGSESGQSGGTDAAPDTVPEPAVSEEEAVAIVLERVPGATAEEITAFGRDLEDGRWEYEGRLIHDGIEYEFEIDAQNGNILDWELED